VKVGFHRGREARDQLLEYVREKQMLLILDGVAERGEAASLVVALLQTGPGVKVVATSRGRLNVDGEEVLELAGMGYPEEGETEKAEEHGAVQLFVQSAKRAKSRFELSEKDKAEVVRICRLVEGNPRAVERAAAWARVLSCAEIAEEIRRDPTFLEEGGGLG
jgi:predicted ATPase